MATNIVNPRNGKSEKIYAILDSGADRDYISQATAERIGLPIRWEMLTMQEAETVSTKMRQLSEISMQSIDGSYKATIDDVIVGPFPSTGGGA